MYTSTSKVSSTVSDTIAHRERAHDLLEKTNPIRYHAPYFGYKLRMDQNEKIA